MEEKKPQKPQEGQNPDLVDPPIEVLKGISIVLDDYDDIFSDFDPRPFEQRQMSEDFLKELSTRYKEDSKGNFEVRFFIPAYERDTKAEVVIKKRLKSHFEREVKNTHEEAKAARLRGLKYITAGIAMLGAEVIIGNTANPGYAMMLKIIEPAGWFATWYGLDKFVEVAQVYGKRVAYNEKFVKCNYMFISDDKE